MTFQPDGDAKVALSDIAFLFHVTIGGEAVGDFQGVENISRQYEAYEYKEGGRNHAPHMLPGPSTYGEITLKSGLMDRGALFAWMEEVELGEDFRKEVQIFQLNRMREQRRAYTLQRAWPTEWKGADLECDDNKLPVEELTLVYDFLEMEVFPHEE